MKNALFLILLAIMVSLIPEAVKGLREGVSKIRFNFQRLLQPSRNAKIQRAWPDFMDDLATGVRSGLPLEQSIIEAATRAPQLLRAILTSGLAHLRAGNNLDSMLDNLNTKPIDHVGKRLLTSLKIASSAGGKDVLTSLQVLAESVRRDLQLIDQLRAKQRSAITGARVAVLAPWLVIGLTSLQPSVKNSYLSAPGLVLISGVLIVSIVAYLWMLQISKLKLGELR